MRRLHKRWTKKKSERKRRDSWNPKSTQNLIHCCLNSPSSNRC